MEPSRVLELNAFVPAKDFDGSKKFYLDIGFELAGATTIVGRAGA